MPHSEFEWDPAKAAANKRKHRVTFDMAAQVLEDAEWPRYHVDESDDEHSMGEDRYITTGSYPFDRTLVLRISWTERAADDGPVTRIISARYATKNEKRAYVEYIKNR